jgi:Putative beta-barrel porin-2, OmpL-like. bbp2
MQKISLNHRTATLIALGVISFASAARAEEKPSTVLTMLEPTILSGYVDTSMQWNLGTGDANAPAYLFGGSGKADGFNLNVVKLVLEHPASLSDDWGAGYKVDLLFGPDAVAYGTQSTGVPNDFAIKQAYVDLKVPLANGFEFKLGVWDTILGYEVFETPVNANFTRSYGYTIEPATFTGLQGTYNINEYISVLGGVADSLSPIINKRSNPPYAESTKAVLGDISFTAPTTANWGWFGGSSLFAAVVHGFSPTASATGLTPANQTSVFVGSTLMTPLKSLKIGLSYDYEGASKQTIAGSLGRAGYANAAAFYGLFQPAEKLAFNTRVEWFTQTPANYAAGLPTKIFALTETIQYSIWKNVITRAEFRWDHQADGQPDAFGGTVPGVGARRNSYEIIGNIIYKF